MSRENPFRLKIGVWTEPIIQLGLQASCESLWWWKCEKWGFLGGSPRGVGELTFSTLEPSWLHLGAILPPKWPQDPPRGHLGTILVTFWYHFGAILVSFYPPAAPTNRHRAAAQTTTWLKNFEAKWAHFLRPPRSDYVMRNTWKHFPQWATRCQCWWRACAHLASKFFSEVVVWTPAQWRLVGAAGGYNYTTIKL